MRIPENLPRFSAYTREEVLRLLLEKEYGCPPPQPDTLAFHVVHKEENAFAGKAVHSIVEAWVTFQGKGFSFPFHLVCPKAGQPVPEWYLSTLRQLCRTHTSPPRSCATWGWR